LTDTTRPSADKIARTAEVEQVIAARTRTLVVGPYPQAGRLGGRRHEGNPEVNSRDHEARLAEAVALCAAIDLTVARAVLVPLRALRPATYLGTGKVEELAGVIVADDVHLVVMDAALTPVQQRNLEKAWNCKVIDRTGLILEIFGRRAATHEGRLQVELAHLDYQKSRLVRSWTHLERQRGGFGFLGGPGETQIETDRRLIQERMTRLKRELADVARTRALNRGGRDKVPFPTVALVGYTNAGKSTLFNRLSRAEVLAQDMLFATLDPTSRAVSLPHGQRIILSDTVGFISDLPTMLIAAFRATLEDVVSADVILHVRDVAHPDSEAQREDVTAILADLGVDMGAGGPVLEVWNKADLLGAEDRQRLANQAERLQAPPALVSALTGEGMDALLERVEARLAQGRITRDLTVSGSDGQLLHWLYESAEVLARGEDEEGDVHLTIRITPAKQEILDRRLGQR
jgi:GTP-binding protein HflX